MVQLAHPYMTTGKTIALTGQTFVSEVMALVNAVLFLRGEEGGGRSWPAVLGRVDVLKRI